MSPADVHTLTGALLGGIFGIVFLVVLFAFPVVILWGMISIIRAISRIAGAIERIADRPATTVTREPEVGPWRRGATAAQSESSQTAPFR